MSAPLEVAGLKAGFYTVFVNGITGTFTLIQDNTTPGPVASLSGLIWHDLCAVGGGEGGAPLIPTSGCVPVENFYRANGVLESGEPGLGGVRVGLGAGICPASGLTETTSNADGEYSFMNLQPGTYCVSIEPLDPQNTPILIPGDWSSPLEVIEQAIASTSVTLSSGENKSGINFGWDYQFLPVPPQVPTPTPAATSTPTPIPIPCDWVKFVADVTVLDYTPYSPGASFNKTWRLQNIGTCTWTTDYDLVFVSGNPMTDKVAYSLPGAVKPGETVDLSIKMIAPYSVGNHKGSWMLRNADGKLFGIGAAADQAFWVLIKVISPNNNYGYDFAANYCLADWYSQTGKLSCPGNTSDPQGFVSLLDNPNLENRNENEPALWLRPNHNTDGWISGEYPPIIIQEGDHFKAWIGCLDDSKGCDVTFTLRYRVDGGTQKTLGEWREVFDGAVTEIDIDLSSLTRHSVEFTLSAEINNKKFESANAFWFVPRIENKKFDKEPFGNSGPAIQAAKRKIASTLGINTKDLERNLSGCF